MIEVSIFGNYLNAQWVCRANGKFLGAAFLARQSAVESALSSLSNGHDVRTTDYLKNIGAYMHSMTRINGYVYAIVIPSLSALVVEKEKGEKKDSEDESHEQSLVWHCEGPNIVWEKIVDIVDTPLLPSWKEYILKGLGSSLLAEARKSCRLPDIPGDRLIPATVEGDADGWQGATIRLQPDDVTALVMHGLETGRLDPYAD